jgi:hypothetical protein
VGGDGLQPHPFSRRPQLAVVGNSASGQVRPEVKTGDFDAGKLICLRLAKEHHKTLGQIEALPTDEVLDMFEYSNFLADYEETAIKLNSTK